MRFPVFSVVQKQTFHPPLIISGIISDGDSILTFQWRAIIYAYNYLLFNMRRNGRYAKKVFTPMEFNYGALYLSLLAEFDEQSLVSVAAVRAIELLKSHLKP